MVSLIVGSQGQDGRILREQLAADGHEILEIARQGPIDLLNADAVRHLIRSKRPDAIYYLAAYHHSAADVQPPTDELMQRSMAVHVVGLTNVLEAVFREHPVARVLYAGSSHVFGQPVEVPQNERTPFSPTCIYGITKTAGIHTCRLYRNTHSLHVSTAILFNHESPLRRENFVSQRIIRGALAIRAGRQRQLVLGDLSAQIDWGWAPDYTRGMRLILSQPVPDDFVVATGILHTVGAFAARVFERLGLDIREYVVEDRRMLAKAARTFVGDPGKLIATTGWCPSVTFDEMIDALLAAAEGKTPAKQGVADESDGGHSVGSLRT